MNSHACVWLLMLLLPLLAVSTEVGAPLDAVDSVEEQIATEKEIIQEEEKKIAKVDKELKQVQHDIKVVTGYRGKESRLDKLDKENRLKLCWWPKDSITRVVIVNDLSNPERFDGIHFKVPDDMHAFKFVERPPVVNPPEVTVVYYVARVHGEFEVENYNDMYRFVDEVLYSGRNPPAEIPVKHKDHLFIAVKYINPRRTNFRVQTTFCSDMSDRVGAPIGVARVFPSNVIEVYGTAESFDNFINQQGRKLDPGNPARTCPLVPIQPSRCF